MSRNSQPAAAAVVVSEFHLVRGQWFGWHRHPDHQLAWASSGVINVRVRDGRTWILPPNLALWLPANVEHDTGASALTTMRSAYFAPERCPLSLPDSTVVAVPPLLRELIVYLGDRSRADEARRHAEAVVFDVIKPVSVKSIGVPDATDPRVAAIATALRSSPADRRSLTEWGRTVGASTRNLARLFVEDTGLTFGQWRTQMRLQSALPLLAAGVAVGRVAERVGYHTPSAFVAAFRRAVGVPPAAYFEGLPTDS
jgi:AraC-like DNA-binding protein